jgi:hypothetical protein
LEADTLVASSGFVVNVASIIQTLSKSAIATQYTYSCYAKAGAFDRVRLYVQDNATTVNRAEATFSLVDGSIAVAAISAGTFTAASAGPATPVGNGWYRCVLTFTSSTETSIRLRIYTANSVAVDGNGFNGIYIWGAQLEVGAFPTSYIPTVASQVTRSADAASMTGANFSSWYNQAAGTLYADYVVNGLNTGAANAAYGISDGTIANHITGRTTESGVTGIINFQVRVGGVNQAALNSVTVAVGAVAKNAAAYAVNDFAFLGNAGAVQTDTVGTLPIVTQMQIGTLLGSTNVLNGTIKKIAYYPARCTNAQLQGLTS